MAAHIGTRPRPTKENTVTLVDDNYTVLEVISAIRDATDFQAVIVCMNINGIWQLTLRSTQHVESLFQQ